METYKRPIIIENITPYIGDGCAIKCVVGEQVVVEADIFKDVHDPLKASLLYKKKDDGNWKSVPMVALENDRWQATFTPTTNARYVYTIEAVVDVAHSVMSEDSLKTIYKPELELMVDRKQAQYGAWYELFPRSQGQVKGQSGTFKDCIDRLPDIHKMGFDVIYLPPIHPIGLTKRKGPNNTLNADAQAPGSPWAIGNTTGGHKAIHPELGSLEDFRAFVHASSSMGIAIALDLAYQCSPDHPYVREHPEWFFHRPDGTIHYAENPPKKYEDIYPLNFFCKNWKHLWEELKSIVTFWIDQGVKIFRVDNPHTKPFMFWKWLIDEIQKDHPDVIFLSEAFTRPNVMKFLAKIGFTQSYTYFSWLVPIALFDFIFF